MEQTLVITFGGTDSEKDSLFYVATKISRKLNKNQVSNIIFDLNNSEFRRSFETKIPKNAVYLILDPYYYISNKRFDIRTILDCKRIRYTGPSISSSANTADKVASKHISSSPLVKNILYQVCKTTDDIHTFVKTTRFQSYILKPIDKGGGEDVFLIHKENIFDFDFELLLKRHKSLLVEEFIKGTELSLPIIRYENEYIDFPIVGITLLGVEIFDASAKRTKSFYQEIPFNLDEENEFVIRTYSKEFYEKINFNGLLRIDFILKDTNVYFLEANGYPNLDEISGISVPAAKKIGLDQIDLINMIVKEACFYG